MNGPAPPPPPYAPPPPRRPHNSPNHSQPPPGTPPNGSGGEGPAQEHGNDKKGLTGGQITGIVIGSVLGAVCLGFAVAFCLRNVYKGKNDTKGRSENTLRPPSVVDTGIFVIRSSTYFMNILIACCSSPSSSFATNVQDINKGFLPNTTQVC